MHRLLGEVQKNFSQVEDAHTLTATSNSVLVGSALGSEVEGRAA